MVSWPNCTGLWALFDSDEWEDHLEARELCQTCSHIVLCAEKALEDREKHRMTPTGTYGGLLWVEGVVHVSDNRTDRVRPVR